MRNLIITIAIALTGLPSCKSTINNVNKMQDSNQTYKIEKTDAEWQQKLTQKQYDILRKKGTERPFTGKYYNFYEDGDYYCTACNHLLFTSDSKFKSGCGWPSFYDVANEKNIKLKEDRSHGMIRTEVLCGNCGGHLGHVFNDGPPPSYLRYCINSAAINFKK